MNESPSRRSSADAIKSQVLAGQISGTVYGLLLYLLEVVFLYREAHEFMGASLISILASYLFFGWVLGSLVGLAAGILLAAWKNGGPAGVYYGTGPVLGLLFTVIYLLRDVAVAQLGRLHPSILVSLTAAVFMWIGIAYLKGRFFAGLRVNQGGRRMVRNTLALLAAFLVVGAAGLRFMEARRLPIRTPVPDSSPNIVLVTVDGLRADHLSAYGYERATTPCLDRLARTGTLFKNAYSHGNRAAYAMPALFTSTYPPAPANAGTGDRMPLLARSKKTTAEVCRDAGYTTVGIMSNVYLKEPFGLTRGFDCVEAFNVFRFKLSVYRMITAIGLISRPDHDDPGTPPAACVTDLGLSWLERLKGRPFFLFLNYVDSRQSCRPPEVGGPDLPAGDRIDGPAGPPAETADVPWRGHKSVLSKAELQQLINVYDRCVSCTDAELGRIFDAVAGLPGGRETVIIFTGSYGTEFFEHGLLFNRNLAVEELIRVPMLIWSSKGRCSDGIVDALVRHVDVLPTIAGLIGVETPEQVVGESLLPFVHGDSPRRNNYSIARGDFCTSLNYDGWKLMRVDSTGTYELYDLASDPWGTASVAGSHPGQLGKLKVRMEQFYDSVRDAESEEALPSSIEERRRLRALGYLQ